MKQGTKQITTTGTINNAYIVSEFTVKCILQLSNYWQSRMHYAVVV
jgi:hypothetical protein